jgi:F-type H+-transporting ATPase subunit b
MLSRIPILPTIKRPIVVILSRNSSFACGQPQPTPPIPRPIRREVPGKVRMGFIPEEWFQFFYPKTGVTGPYVFGAALITYLCSKEIYVLEHEYYSGLSLAVMCYLAVKKLGPKIAEYSDKQIEKIEKEWEEAHEGRLNHLQALLNAEEKENWRAEGMLLLMDAKQENIDLQLEAAYRERQMEVYNEVKGRLDYQVERVELYNRIAKKHMINWVIKNAMKSVTPDMDKEKVQKVISELPKYVDQK